MALVTQSLTPFVPGIQMVDGSLLNAILSSMAGGTADGVTASTTQTRAGGTALTSSISRVTTAAASDAVTLLGAGATPKNGAVIIVANKSGQTIQVFPPGASDTIDGGVAGAAVNLGTAKIGVYVCTAVIGGVCTWVSGSMAVSS